MVEALLDLAELRADHGGGLADGLLGGVDSPGGVLDGVGGGPVAAVDELAELAVGDAVVVHGFLLFIPGAGRGGGAPLPEAGGQAVRARVAARAIVSMASAGSAASVTWQWVKRHLLA